MRLVDGRVEDDGDEEDQALHGAHPGAGEARGDEAGLDHAHDEGAEDGADDGRPAAEDRGAADQHGGDGGEQVALALIAEVVLVLERQHDRRDGGEPAHQGEQLDLLALDRDADDARHVVGIAEEQHVLAEAVAVEDEPQHDADRRRPHRLDRDLRPPAGRILLAADAPDEEDPDARLVDAAQRIGLAARDHRRHAGPEELRAERRDEGGDADAARPAGR